MIQSFTFTYYVGNVRSQLMLSEMLSDNWRVVSAVPIIKKSFMFVGETKEIIYVLEREI